MAYDKAEWRASVRNGEIPRGLLAEIVPVQYDPDLGGPALMHPEAAAAMTAFLKQARATGHVSLKVKYSYRTLTKQREKYANYQAGGNLAAVPGTSNHGWAVAVDFNWTQPQDIEWAHNNEDKYGFAFDVPSENWHCTYQGGFKEEDMSEYADGVDAFIADPARDIPGAWSAEKTKGFKHAKYLARRPFPVDHEHDHAVLGEHKHIPGGIA